MRERHPQHHDFADKASIGCAAVFDVPKIEPGQIGVASRVVGRQIHTVVAVHGASRAEIDSLADPIYGYALAKRSGMRALLAFVIDSESGHSWLVQSALAGDASQVAASEPDAHVIALVDAKDGVVKQVRTSSLPTGIAAADLGFIGSELPGSVWDDGARWVQSGGGWEPANDSARASEALARA